MTIRHSLQIGLALGGLTLSSCLAQSGPVPVEPQAGKWKTWSLASGDQMRLPAPPDGRATAAEQAWLKLVIPRHDENVTRQIRHWDAGDPGYRWREMYVAEGIRRGQNNVVINRGTAILSVAMYDAIVAAWDSKYTYNRPRPSASDSSIAPLVAVPRTPSYPDEHAVAAGAASAVLAYLYPDRAKDWEDLAQEAARSRLYAGVAYPSDMLSGLQLGRQVAALTIANAKRDGSDAVWTGTVPSGACSWRGVNPVLPLTGTWRPWMLTTGSQFRPGPPPPCDSDQMAADLSEVKNFPRTFDTSYRAMFWQSAPGPKLFGDLVNQKVFEYHLEENAPRVARIWALTSVTVADSTIACWDAKYTYWAIRPFMLDTGVTTLFTTPNHPSYPAAHACNSGGDGAMLSYLFPNDADFFTAQANEAGQSRIWAGIHFRSDVAAGLALGRSVAQWVIEQRAKQDGADQ